MNKLICISVCFVVVGLVADEQSTTAIPQVPVIASSPVPVVPSVGPQLPSIVPTSSVISPVSASAISAVPPLPTAASSVVPAAAGGGQMMPPMSNQFFDQRAGKMRAALEDETKPRSLPIDPAKQAALDGELNKFYFDLKLVHKKLAINVAQMPVRVLFDMVARTIGIPLFVDNAIKGTIDAFRAPEVDAGQLLLLLCHQTIPESALVKAGDLWLITSRSNAYQMIKDVHSRQVAYKVFPVNHANIDSDFRKKVEEGWKQIVKDESMTYLYIDAEQKKIYAKADENSLKEFYEYLREVDRPILQVRIDAIILLARKDFTFDFGIDWSGIYNREQTLKANNSEFGFYGLGGTLLDFPNPGGADCQGTLNPQVPNPPNTHNPCLYVNPLNFAINLFNSGAAFFSGLSNRDTNMSGLIRIPFVFGGTDLSLRRLNLVLNMAEIEEKINIVSRPSILTSNNKVAKILIGQSIPLQLVVDDLTTQLQGNISRTYTTINYKDTGVVLEVRPLVSPDHKSIYLDILVEDSLVESGTTLTNERGIMTNPPTISVIKTKNEVVLRNGQTTIIGGLSSKTTGSTKRGVPLLSQIPIFGNLFKATMDISQDRERFIFITPTIVEYESW